MSILQFEPEPLEQMRERFPPAVSQKFFATSRMQAAANPRRPGRNRRNVFDHEDGLRMVVSWDAVEDVTGLHISASVVDDSEVFKAAERIRKRLNGEAAVDYLDKLVLGRFQAMSDITTRPGKIATTTGRVFHYLIPHWSPDEWERQKALDANPEALAESPAA